MAAKPADISAGKPPPPRWDSMWMVASGTVHVFSHIFEAEAAQADLRASSASATSPTRRSTSASTPALLLLALVSLSLGLINLLPILPLDGGHIFWALVEKLRGGPVSLRVMERATRDRLRAGRWC